MWLGPPTGVVVIGRVPGTDSNSCTRRGLRRRSDAGRPNSIQSIAVWHSQPLAHWSRLPFKLLDQQLARCPAGTGSSAARAVLTIAIPRGCANFKCKQYAKPGRKVIWAVARNQATTPKPTSGLWIGRRTADCTRECHPTRLPGKRPGARRPLSGLEPGGGGSLIGGNIASNTLPSLSLRFQLSRGPYGRRRLHHMC